MTKYFIVSILNGLLFGILDGIINANPYTQQLFQVYEPIAKTSINASAGIIIDVFYGLIMGFLFLLLYKSIPGQTGLIKGIVFALIIWFFRVLMSVVTTWMMFTVPTITLLYLAATGLIEMLILGTIYGLFLKPFGLKQ